MHSDSALSLLLGHGANPEKSIASADTTLLRQKIHNTFSAPEIDQTDWATGSVYVKANITSKTMHLISMYCQGLPGPKGFGTRKAIKRDVQLLQRFSGRPTDMKIRKL